MRVTTVRVTTVRVTTVTHASHCYVAPVQPIPRPVQEGRYCPRTQPPTSAFREPSFGHGLLRVHNHTRATWTWNRNQVRHRPHWFAARECYMYDCRSRIGWLQTAWCWCKTTHSVLLGGRMER